MFEIEPIKINLRVKTRLFRVERREIMPFGDKEPSELKLDYLGLKVCSP